MAKRNISRRDYIQKKLRLLKPIFVDAAIGEFSKSLILPKREDEFTELYVGIQLMLDVIREQTMELKKLNKSLRGQIKEKAKLDKQKDEFIAMASHELKTPMTTVKAYLQILKERKFGIRSMDIKTQSYFSKMEHNVNRLARLVDELLDVSRIESGKLEFDSSVFDINELIRETVGDFRSITPSHPISSTFHSPVFVKGDKFRLSEVFANLLSNAIKYSQKGKKIKVSVTSRRNKVSIAVKDFGIGIPKKDRKKVFDRFFRSDVSPAGKVVGLGLGLYICAEIIKRHDGRIRLTSKLGKGSVFYVELPIYDKIIL